MSGNYHTNNLPDEDIQMIEAARRKAEEQEKQRMSFRKFLLFLCKWYLG